VDQLTGAASQQLDVNDPDQRRKAVRATIQASTSLLSPGDHDRFAELAVFAEDETIPVTLITELWRATGPLDEMTTRALCARLADLALLTLIPGGDGGAVTMHDMIREFLRQELGDTRLTQLHGLLLDTVADGLPVAAPAEPGGGDPKVTAWWMLPGSARYRPDGADLGFGYPPATRPPHRPHNLCEGTGDRPRRRLARHRQRRLDDPNLRRCYREATRDPRRHHQRCHRTSHRSRRHLARHRELGQRVVDLLSRRRDSRSCPGVVVIPAVFAPGAVQGGFSDAGRDNQSRSRKSMMSWGGQ
jgi:hypothetical protein